MPSPAPVSSSFTQDTYERLRADLLACRLQPGAKLKIADLCRAHSVGLSAVREALSRLTSEGLVVAEPQRGFRVTPISDEDLRDLTAVRCLVEGLCLERAIAVRGPAWKERLAIAFDAMSKLSEREPSDPNRMNEAWSQAHADFHQALVGACDSPCLLRVRAGLYAQSERYRRLSVHLEGASRDLNSEHKAIMEAALTLDTDRAKSLLSAHIAFTTNLLASQSWLTRSGRDNPSP